VSRVRRWSVPLLAVGVLSVLLGGCGGLLGSFVSTRDGLSQAGFSHVSVGVASQDNLKITVTVDQNASDGEIREIAAVVWRDFHQRFDLLEITLHAQDRTVSESIPFALLRQQLGARPAADDRTSLRNGIIHVGIVVLLGLLAVVVVVVVLVVILVRRRRRRSRVGPAGPPPVPWRPGGSAEPWGPGAPPGGSGPGGPGPWGLGAPPGESSPGAPAPAPWGAPVPAPSEPEDDPDPWQPPPGSGPPAWG
jgi:hypothetical protein